ncbi:MAG: dihydroneopterin aldolase [Muribaculaceae bacterium]|nr:dihydroneopterin aldolase [Muribaculaceae bacterium]MDE6197365.1 dihydroneopterin aldolase [Muribaculaceae bacterium]
MQYDRQPQGSIKIEGLKIFARHGVLPQERTVGNMFEINATFHFPCSYAMRSDRVDLTINYADIVDIMKQEMAYPSKLLENVVYRMFQNLTIRFPQISGGSISLYKIQPPISAEIGRIGFTFEW